MTVVLFIVQDLEFPSGPILKCMLSAHLLKALNQSKKDSAVNSCICPTTGQ